MFLPPEIQNFYHKNPKRSLTVYKSGLGSQAYIAQALLNKGRDVVVILPDENSLFQFREIVRLLHTSSQSGQEFWNHNWMFLPAYSCWSSLTNDWSRKWTVLFKLIHGPKPKGIVLTLDNLLPLWPSRKLVENEFLFLMRNEEFSWEEIQDKLVNWGYTHVSLVTRQGEFSRRGDILDIYSPGYDYPLRLEFFGDNLESLRLFEPVTQRSKSELQEAVVLPFSPVVFEDRLIKQAREYWNYLWKTGMLSKKEKSSLEQKVQEGDHGILPGLFYSRKVSLSAWLPQDPVFILKESDKIRSNLEECAMNWKNFLAREKQDSGYAWPEEAITQSVASAREVWINQSQILFEELPVGSRKQGVELPEKKFDNFRDLFWQPEQKNRPLKALLSALGDWKRTKNQVVLSFKSDNSRKKFRQLVEDADASMVDGYNPQQKGIYTAISSLEHGLEMEWNHVLFLSEEVLHPRRGEKRKKRISDEQFDGLQTYEDIKKDDLLVHRDYGLGRFGGLTRLQANNTGNDYLVLDYAGGDKLYVPVDKLNLIQKYKGPEGATPALDKLGGSGWHKAKEKARKALQEIAHDLVQMYAYRSVAKGYTYSPPEELYKEFEATFDFEETADQEQAINAVLKDMDSQEPMDRLVCGDSGFGKTEVAMRAAFRAVVSGKQVCLLCPTTVLAEQHYQNFQKRMDGFPVRIAMISRFITSREQKKILASAERGEVDILIGTHRVLSSDVYLPRLSLFILDEEQRFGVRHKEKLKKIRQNIDVLTLTATPIP
ncbi:MAG: DEAD/DEAH box helicase, partial [Thermodesulfobacteriota bacterium]